MAPSHFVSANSRHDRLGQRLWGPGLMLHSEINCNHRDCADSISPHRLIGPMLARTRRLSFSYALMAVSQHQIYHQMRSALQRGCFRYTSACCQQEDCANVVDPSRWAMSLCLGEERMVVLLYPC